MGEKITVKLEKAGKPEKGLIPAYSGHTTTRGRRSVALISERQVVENPCENLTAQLAILTMDFMNLHKVSKLGAEDEKLTDTDIRNILRDVQKKVSKVLEDIPEEAKEMLRRQHELEASLHEMLELSWEWAVETRQDDNADDRQLRAIELLGTKEQACQKI